MSGPPEGTRAAAQSSAPQQPPVPQASGITGWVGSYVVGYFASHETSKREFDWEVTPCGRLIQDISHQATLKIIALANSKIAAGGQEKIEKALKDLLGEVFMTYATKGIAHAETLTAEQLSDHFLASIIAIIKAEFELPGISTKDHFKNIARALLKGPFPKELEDPHLPAALQDILRGKGMRGWALSWFIDTKDLNWEKIVTLFSEHLEAIYNSITNPATVAVNEEQMPGVEPCANFIVSNVTNLPLSIRLLSAESNQFINEFRARLLREDIKNLQDKPILDEARNWLIREMNHGCQAMLVTLLEPVPGQTHQVRRQQIAERLLAKAATLLPETIEARKKIQTMPEARLLDLLKSWQNVEDKAPFHEELKASAKKIETAKDGEKAESLVEARGLCLDITTYFVIETLLLKELDLQKLQKLLPPSLPLKGVLEQIYRALVPYVTELIVQSADIAEKGDRYDAVLKQQGGQEVAVWIDNLLSWGKNLLETKALANTFKPAPFAFVNEMFCHVLKPSQASALVGAKEYVNKMLKDLIIIILYKAIERNRIGDEPIAKTLARVVNSVLEQGQNAIQELTNAKEADPHAFLVERSRQILATVFPKELFNELMPPFLRNLNLWELVADNLLATYLQGVYSQTLRMQQASRSPRLVLQVPEVKVLLTDGVKKLMEKFNAPTQDQSTLAQVQTGIFQGSAFQTLFQKLAPTICEAILAYHLNPKEQSAERAANLFLQLMSITEKGFEAIDDFEAAKNKQQWLVQHGMKPEMQASDVKEHLLKSCSQNLLNLLLPKELADSLIPPEFALFNIPELLSSLSSDYIKQAYDYSYAMKSLARTGVGGEPHMLSGVDTFIQKKLQGLFASSTREQASWMQQVAEKIFTTTDPNQKEMVHRFSSNTIFCALGFLVANAKTLPGADAGADGNLLTLVAPIAAASQHTFNVLNERKSTQETIALLQISDDEIKLFLENSGQKYETLECRQLDVRQLDVRQLAYFVSARRAINKLFNDEQWQALILEPLRALITKEAASMLACPVLEMVHDVQELLYARSALGLTRARQEAGLEEYINQKVVQGIVDELKTAGKKEEPLGRALPPLLDSLMRQIFRDTTTSMGAIRDLLVSRAVYTVVEGLLVDKEAIIGKLEALVRIFKRENHELTAAELLHTALPREFFSLPLTKVVVEDVALPKLTSYVEQIDRSAKRLMEQGELAKQYLDAQEGVSALVATMVKSLDDSLDEMANDPTEQVSKNLPKAIDDQLKRMLKSPELRPVVQKALHSLLFICLKQVITPGPLQTVEERVLEVSAKMMDLFNQEKQTETGAQWLQELLPTPMLQQLLPEFLRPVVTHEKLVEWFFKPEMEQVVTERQRVRAHAMVPPSVNVLRLQGYFKNWLLEFTTPSATKRGLSGFEGVVRQVEKRLIETLATQDAVGKGFEEYLNAVVGQITRTLERKNIMREDFIAEALIGSLPQLGANPPELENVPSDGAFANEAAKRLLGVIFPQGPESLLVPEVAKKAVWMRIEKALTDTFTDMTSRDRRLLFAMERLIPLTTDDQRLIGRRRQEVEDMRYRLQAGQRDPNFMQIAEERIKEYTVEASVRQADLEMQKSSLWGPLKWVARQAVKLTTYLAARFALKDRVWNFLSDANSDNKIRRFLWAFLHTQPPAAPQPLPQRKQRLKASLDTALQDADLLPWILRGPASNSLANYYANLNFAELIA